MLPRKARSMRNPRQIRSRAFTLVELLVVVMILAIVAAVAVPYAVGTGDFQAMSAARRIAGDLEYAQNAAITTQTPVTVTFDVSGESYSVTNASGLLTHPITKLSYVIDFDSEESFNQLDLATVDFAGAAAVEFDELGSPDNGGTVTLRAGPNTYQVSVAPATGKVTVTHAGP